MGPPETLGSGGLYNGMKKIQKALDEEKQKEALKIGEFRR